MKTYIVVNNETGEITRGVTVSDPMYMGNVPHDAETETVQEMPDLDVSTGQLMEFYYKDSNGNFIERGARPSNSHIWTASGWGIDLVAASAELRAQRDYLLSSSDWTQIADSPFDATKKNEWRVYRQALRDLPSAYVTEQDFTNIVWPEKPV